MKKIINAPQAYVNEMLQGIYAAHGNLVQPASGDLKCYTSKQRIPGKVGIVTGGGSGHLPLFLGYIGQGMLDGCAVGEVFQSPSAEQIYEVTRAVDQGAGVLYLYGNYTGDIMNFNMAAELADMDGIRTLSLVGNDDVVSAPKGSEHLRRGVAGIFFMYKCVGALADEMGSLEEVRDIAAQVGNQVRTMGFATAPCILPEVGRPNFQIDDSTIAVGMGIHGEPGIRESRMMTADQIAAEAVEAILRDLPFGPGEQAAVLINGLGATPLDEQYILYNSVYRLLENKGISVFHAWAGEFATSMEMAGVSISILKTDAQIRRLLAKPAYTPFYCQPALQVI